ncbi:MAG: iron-containing alcohol dehydrogenase [Pseudomonadota bacterium]|nr:iron-containing alcohol dehydrogenase [Pseudomonadota bacterium]
MFGRPWGEAVAEEVTRIGAQRIFVLAAATLATNIGLESQVHAALSDRLAGFATGIRGHAPRADVIAATDRVRASGADFILAIGGGSVIDAAKIVSLCIAANVHDAEHLGTLAASRHKPLPENLPVRIAAIPTTLSGAEFTHFAGATDTQRQIKEAYAHPFMVPRFVVLDAAITVPTPRRIWLSTGIRALDHAVESICSVSANPLSDATAIHSLKLLVSGLPLSTDAPNDMQARLDCLNGVWLSAVGLQSGVPMGASHGIGHALGGTAGVPHGETSCVMLAHVLRWNKSANAERQLTVSAAMGDVSVDAGDLVGRLVAGLGLPTRLRDVGVLRGQFAQIASTAFRDPWTQANPRPIESVDTIVDLLEAAW